MTRRQWKHTKASLIAERDVALEMLDGMAENRDMWRNYHTLALGRLGTFERRRPYTLCLAWFAGAALGLLAGWQL